MKTTTKLWMWLVILALFSPLGLIIPEYFKAGSAWGEWGAPELQKLAGYIPKGLIKLSGLWNAPLADYAFKGWEEKGLFNLSVAYIISAIAGILIVAVLTLWIGNKLTRKE